MSAARGSGPRYVAVVGPGDARNVPLELAELAREVGRELAAAGAVVLCGGLDGVMAAVSEGVAAQGGQCVGLLPGDTRAEANAFLSLALPTGLGQARNAVIVCASDVVIAIGAGYGTLSEIGLALRAGKPVVGLRTWAIEELADEIHSAGEANEAVSKALELAGPARA